jgi:hypothetical protein
MKRISYIFSHEVNYGTDEEPKIEVVETPKIFECNESNFDAAYAIAQKEAYNGEVTIEDLPDPILPPTPEQRIAELEARNAALEDALCELDAMLCKEV